MLVKCVTFANVLECGGRLYRSSGQISFSSQHYNSSVYNVCAWTITVPGQSIELTLWSLEADDNYGDDALKVIISLVTAYD